MLALSRKVAVAEAKVRAILLAMEDPLQLGLRDRFYPK